MMNCRQGLVIFGFLFFVLMFFLARRYVSVEFGDREQQKEETAKAIEQFHIRLAQGRFDEIYDDADESFQWSQSRAKLIEAMGETRTQFGGFKRAVFSELNVIVGAPVQIRAVYNSSFDKGDATELFTFVKRNNDIKLAAYAISRGTVRPRTP